METLKRLLSELEIYLKEQSAPILDRLQKGLIPEQKLWAEGLFPIFTDGGGDYLLLDCNKDSVSNGMILIYSPSLLLDENPQSMYDSLEDLMMTALACFKTGAYKININGTIDADYDLQYELSAKLNPKSLYWDEYR